MTVWLRLDELLAGDVSSSSPRILDYRCVESYTPAYNGDESRPTRIRTKSGDSFVVSQPLSLVAAGLRDAQAKEQLDFEREYGIKLPVPSS